MAMELHRRLRNSSRQLTTRAKSNIVCQFVNKLRSSGHGPSTVRRMIESGTKFFYRKLICDLEGGPKLNDRPELSETQLVLRRRQKLGASQ